LYKNGTLSEEKINQLNKINFKFSIGVGEYNRKEVICIETKEVFKSMAIAGKKYSCRNICLCCQGKQKYAGKHPETREPLHWMYYDEYVKLYGEVA
jgi:hypothetical protein